MILRWRKFVQESDGTVMGLTAILIAVLLGFCGLAIDVGHYMVVKNELQNAADAGALAGVRALFPADMTTATNPLTPDCTTAVNVGLQAAHWNKTDRATTVVVGQPLTGYWEPVNRQFVAGCSSDPATFTNAVKVTTQREDTPLFLMQVLGAVPKTIQASSVAAIFPVKGLKGGAFPVAITKKFVRFGGQLRIYLNSDLNPDPTLPFDPLTNPGDVGCWFLPGDSSSDFLGNVKSVLNGSTPIGPLATGDPIYMNNGVTTSLFNLVNNYVGQTVWLPVVAAIKYNQSDNILGFTGFKIQSTGQYKGKHYIQGLPTVMAEAPGSSVDDGIGTDYGLEGPARLVY